MINPTTLPSGVTIAEVTDSSSISKGQLNANSEITIPIFIENTSSSEVKIEVGVVTGYATESQGVAQLIYDNGKNPISNTISTNEVGTSGCSSTMECTDECSSKLINGEWIKYCTCNTGEPVNPPYPMIAAEFIEMIYDPTTMNNDDPDGNVRYMGADPNNYVSFNNELWRIIGVFDVKSSVNGQTEKRLKIIRDESLGDMAWDSANTNNWTSASLQTYLNGDYYNSLDSISQSLIGDTYWNLGGTASYTSASNGLASHFYGYERGTTVYSGRPTYWVGKIGLMYPSDYGYATSGGTTTNRQSCLAKELYNWNNSNYSDCKNNDYLFDSSIYQWTLTPYSSNSNYVFSVRDSGCVRNYVVSYSIASRPVLYLKSTVEITGGNGTFENPFTFG